MSTLFRSSDKLCSGCEEKQKQIDYLKLMVDRLLNANGIAGVITVIDKTAIAGVDNQEEEKLPEGVLEREKFGEA